MNEIQISYICHVVIDYVYMCTNNAIISNIQSKDFIAVRCLHVTHVTFTPICMQFSLVWLFAKKRG